MRPNVTGTRADATSVLVAPDAAPGAGLDVSPATTDVVSITIDVPMLPDADRDFDGRMRDGTRAGAHAGPAAADSWALDRDRKP